MSRQTKMFPGCDGKCQSSSEGLTREGGLGWIRSSGSQNRTLVPASAERPRDSPLGLPIHRRRHALLSYIVTRPSVMLQ